MKAIVLAYEKNERLFPFEKTYQASCLPILNQENIKRIIHDLETLNIAQKDIYVLLSYRKEQVRAALCDYQHIHIIELQDIFRTLTDLEALIDDKTIIIHGDLVISINDLEYFIEQSNENTLLVLDKEEKSIQTIGVRENEEGFADYCLHSPREHYINRRSAGLYCFTKAAYLLIKRSGAGFEKRIAGTQIEEGFYIENAINLCIKSGYRFKCIPAKQNTLRLIYPWDIAKANEIQLKLILDELSESEIDPSTTIEESSIINGILRTGKNTYIGHHVIITGRVYIEDDVVIRDGALLKGDIYIASDTVIQEYSKIKHNSVIGAENKIGYMAEVQGITFTGFAAIHSCELYGVFGRYVDIGALSACATLRFDDYDQIIRIERHYHANPYTNMTYIGDYARIGIHCSFYPGSQIGSDTWILPTSIVRGRIEHGTRYSG